MDLNAQKEEFSLRMVVYSVWAQIHHVDINDVADVDVIEKTVEGNVHLHVNERVTHWMNEEK